MAAIVVFLSYGALQYGLFYSKYGHPADHHHNNFSAPPPPFDVNNVESHSEYQSPTLVFYLVAFFGVGFGSGLGYMAALGCTTRQLFSTPYLGRTVGIIASGYGLSSTLVGMSYHKIGLHYFFGLWACLVAGVNVVGVQVFSSFTRTADASSQNTSSFAEREQANHVPAESPFIQAASAEEEREGVEVVMEKQKAMVGGSHLRTPVHRGKRPTALPEQPPSVEISDDYESSEEPLLPFDVTSNSSTPWNTWKKNDFWILLLTFASMTGCGLFIINNISTMVQSLEQTDSLASVALFVLSGSNVFGRIVMGILSDQFCELQLLQISCIIMAVGLWISFVYSGALQLLITVGFVSLAFGGAWVLIVPVVSNRFGKTNFGRNYGLIAMGPALSGMIFNTMSAWLYQSQIAQSDSDHSGVCIGPDCYRISYLVASFAAMLGYFLVRRLR